jgi:hypothetical protein
MSEAHFIRQHLANYTTTSSQSIHEGQAQMCSVASLAQPAATVIAAVAAVFVTWWLGNGQLRIAKQQAATARQQAELAAVRLQHDLFDRRFAIYEAAQKLALEVFETASVSREGLSAFIRSTEKSVFLLDKNFQIT